jgi:hypothetical protein
MSCILCGNLERALDARRREYIEANSAAYFQVSKKFAAYINVEMERARNELEDHRLTCVFAANTFAPLPAVGRPHLGQQEIRSGDPVETAA